MDEKSTKLETLRIARNLRKEISYTEGMITALDLSTRGAIDELLTEIVKVVNAKDLEEMVVHWKNIREITNLFIEEPKNEETEEEF